MPLAVARAELGIKQMGILFKFVIGPVIAAIIGRGALEAIHFYGWFPDRWLTHMLTTSPAVYQSYQSEITWIASALFSVVLVVVWHFFHLGPRLAGWGRLFSSSKQASPPESVPAISSLQMSVGENGPYFNTEGSLYSIRRTFNLKLENIDLSKPVSNYSVKILSVTPATEYEGPWLLEERMTLAAGDHVFIPLVTYGEARDSNKFPCGDSFMTMGTADKYPLLDIGEKYTVTMRATAPETPYCEFQCRIWVDDSGRLRIESSFTASARKKTGSGSCLEL